ncbi:testis-specific gene 10 protein [Latimeria chalumnae]|uniref:testis-specific gene 10 protein n=1 Tax=Latimeria chalumnae TaxID=7897 RepID=UPI00313D60E1
MLISDFCFAAAEDVFNISESREGQIEDAEFAVVYSVPSKKECLQQTDHALECHIQQPLESKVGVSSSVESLTNKNEELCEEVTETDGLAELLEKEKETELITTDQELQSAETSKENLEKAEAELTAKAKESRKVNELLDQFQEEKERLETEQAQLNLKLARRDKPVSHLHSFVKTLEEERDYYKSEVEHLRKMNRGRSASPKRGTSVGRSPVRTSPVKGGSYESELMRLIRERNELHSMLEKYERHLAEIQGNIKVLTAERNQTNKLYEQAQEEIGRLRREVIKSPRTPKTTLTAQAILRRLEAERDEATADLRRMTTERDSLRERLKISQMASINERAHLEQRTENLQSAIHMMESERLEQKSRMTVMKKTILSLEDEVKTLLKKATEAEDELTRQKSECSSLRLLSEKVEHTLFDAQHRLSLKSREYETLQEIVGRCDEKIDTLTRQSVLQQDEINILQTKITNLDQEKDALQETTDTKTEKIVSLEENIAFKEKTISALRKNNTEKENATEQLRATISNCEREISSLRRQLDALNKELTETGKAREAVAQDKNQLLEELRKVKQDNQLVNSKLESSVQENQDLKLKVQDCNTNVTRLENLLSSKEKEKREILDKFLRANGEAENWETRAHQAEGEASSVRLAVLNAESECCRMKERIESLEKEINEHVVAQKTQKVQISALNNSIVMLEKEVQQTKAEKISVLNDLASTRDLCVKLDASKETVSRQLSSKTQEMERMLKELESAGTEIGLLRQQLASERISMKSLESVLASNREKEFQSQMTTQEKDSEIQLFKEKLALSDSKVMNQSREITQLQNKLTQLEAEFDITKRQLSTERFERQVYVQNSLLFLL